MVIQRGTQIYSTQQGEGKGPALRLAAVMISSPKRVPQQYNPHTGNACLGQAGRSPQILSKLPTNLLVEPLNSGSCTIACHGHCFPVHWSALNRCGHGHFMLMDGTPHMVGMMEWVGTSRVLISLSKAILQVCCKVSELFDHQHAHWGLVGQHVQELQPNCSGDGECPAKQPGEGALYP